MHNNFFFPLPPQPFLAKLAGAFHYLNVEVGPHPINLPGRHFRWRPYFQTCTELVKPTLSALDRASGPSSSVSLSGEGPYFRSQLPAGKAGVPCLVHRCLPTFLLAPTLLRIRPGFRLKGKGKPDIPLKGNSGEKPALKQLASRVRFPFKTTQKKIRVISPGIEPSTPGTVLFP